jgi:hypothetical protein
MNKTRAVAILAVAAVFVGLDALYGKAMFTGFAVLVGTAGSVALMFGTRWLGTALVKRPETWLGVDTPPDTHPDLAGGDIAIGEAAHHD